MPTPELTTNVTYKSGTNEALGAGWDVMQVVARRNDGEQNSFMIARDAGGNIIRKTDIILDRWEVVSDEESLKTFRHCFNERDRLVAEKAANVENVKDPCQCGHAFTSHTRHIRERSDLDALNTHRPTRTDFDYNTGRPAGESGCTECDCRQWEHATH